MKLINLKCQNCGADLEINPEKKEMFCSYCGARLMMAEDSVHVTRIVDEARLKEAEVRLKELEYQHERELREEGLRKEQRKAGIASVIVYIVVLLISYMLPELRPVSVLVLVFGGIALISSRSGDRKSRTSGRAMETSRKSKTIALLLCIFTGMIGGHYFYAGRYGMGILYLLTFGFFGVGWLIDVARIACGGFRDRDGRFIEN